MIQHPTESFRHMEDIQYIYIYKVIFSKFENISVCTSTVVCVLILATKGGTGRCICKTVQHVIIYTVSHMASHRLIIPKTNWRLTCPVCTAPELHTHTLGHRFHTDRLSSLLGSVDGSTWCCFCSA